MTPSSLQTFVNQVTTLAKNRCGNEFALLVSSIRREREMMLSSTWKPLEPEIDTRNEQHPIYRDIDFDTIITHSSKYLPESEYVTLLYEIADAARNFGHFDKADQLLGLILRKHAHCCRRAFLANTHDLRGNLYFYKNDLENARKEFSAALALFEAENDQIGVASIKNSIGVLKVEEGKAIEEAEKDFLDALAISTKANDSYLLLRSKLNLANVYVIGGDLDKALQYYQEIRDDVGNNENEELLANVFHSLAIVFKFKKEFNKASDYLSRSLKISNHQNNMHLKALSYLEQAEVYYHKGDFATSTALATTSFQIFSQLGDRLSLADVYKILGMINRDAKRFNLALSYLENSLKINEEFSYPLNLGETQFELGQFYTITGDFIKARAYYNSALDSFRQINANGKIRDVQKAMESAVN